MSEYNLTSYYNDSFGIDSADNVNAIIAFRATENAEPPALVCTLCGGEAQGNYSDADGEVCDHCIHKHG